MTAPRTRSRGSVDLAPTRPRHLCGCHRELTPSDDGCTFEPVIGDTIFLTGERPELAASVSHAGSREPTYGDCTGEVRDILLVPGAGALRDVPGPPACGPTVCARRPPRRVARPGAASPPPLEPSLRPPVRSRRRSCVCRRKAWAGCGVWTDPCTGHCRVDVRCRGAELDRRRPNGNAPWTHKGKNLRVAGTPFDPTIACHSAWRIPIPIAVRRTARPFAC